MLPSSGQVNLNNKNEKSILMQKVYLNVFHISIHVIPQAHNSQTPGHLRN